MYKNDDGCLQAGGNSLLFSIPAALYALRIFLTSAVVTGVLLLFVAARNICMHTVRDSSSFDGAPDMDFLFRVRPPPPQKKKFVFALINAVQTHLFSL